MKRRRKYEPQSELERAVIRHMGLDSSAPFWIERWRWGKRLMDWARAGEKP